MTDNRNFAEHDRVFRLACQLAGVEPTKRQASKFRRNQGSAAAFRQQAIEKAQKPAE